MFCTVLNILTLYPLVRGRHGMGFKPLYSGFDNCFGWGPRLQTTEARVLVGTPSTKTQTHVFWLGPPAPNHRRTCFGWGPQPQTTDARVLVGAPSPKPQTYVFWLGPPAPNHRRTCFGWGPQPQTTDARVLVGTPSSKLVKVLGSDCKKLHLESRCCAILGDNV